LEEGKNTITNAKEKGSNSAILPHIVGKKKQRNNATIARGRI
jgi:hypothetical protein